MAPGWIVGVCGLDQIVGVQSRSQAIHNRPILWKKGF
jgi:hypothetical protein